MNDETSRVGLTTLLLAGLMLFGCEEPPQSDAPMGIDPTASLAAPLEEIDMEWIALDEEQVIATSRVVVHGKVIALEATHHRSFPYSDGLGRTLTAAEAGDDYSDLPLTVATVEIIDTLRQEASAAPRAAHDTVRVVFIGGQSASGEWVVPQGQPIPAQGDEAVFFLAAPMRPSTLTDFVGVFSLTGGGQGFLAIRNGAIFATGSGAFDRLAGGRTVEVVEALRQRMRTLPAGLPYPIAHADTLESE